MLAYIVGHVDINSAAVLVSFFGMITIIGAIWFAKRRSRVEIDNDFELAKIKQADEQALWAKKNVAAHVETQYKLETDRLMKMGQVEQGLITSHARAGTDRKPGFSMGETTMGDRNRNPNDPTYTDDRDS